MEDATAFHAALDSVARERRWLARNEAPPLEKTVTFMESLIAAGNVQLLAHHGGAVVGWCDVHPRNEDPAVGIVGIGLIKDWRGKGLGEKLLRGALDAAKDRFQRIQLDVRVDNAAAIALYKKLGFNVESQYRRDVPDVEADLYTMIWQGFPT